MNDRGTVVYRVDAKDRIVFVNEEWDRFAEANDGESVAGAKVLLRPLWDYITGPTARHLYKKLLARVRGGRVVRFPLRCDSPGARRLLELTASSAGDEVEFRVRLASLEPRPPRALLDPRAARAPQVVRACGWCAKIEAEGAWREVDEAVEKLKLFVEEPVPAITHGICPPCEARVSAEIDAA